MKKKYSLITSLFFVTFAGVTILSAILLTSSALKAIQTTKENFGSAASYISKWQSARLAIALNRNHAILITPVTELPNEVIFTISDGESVNSIIDRLFLEGLILSTDAVYDYLIYSGKDRFIQSGEYALSSSMNAIEIIDILKSQGNTTLVFVVLPGWRIEEIAASIPSYGLTFSPDEFIETASLNQFENTLVQFRPSNTSLEGYLFPGEYTITYNTSATELIALMLNAFESNLLPDLEERAIQQNLTLHEVITLASIIEREAVIEEEKPLIASVYLNRLAIDMKLQADPTVQFALGFNNQQNTWWTNPLSYADLEYYSAYNTYIVQSLPPGPISNPDLNSLLAVVLPAESPYFFFQAKCDLSGFHNFSITYEEHLQNNCP